MIYQKLEFSSGCVLDRRHSIPLYLKNVFPLASKLEVRKYVFSTQLYIILYLLAGYTKEYASWVRVERNASCEGGGGGEGRARFVSDQVHFVSNEEIFVTGNALLYRYACVCVCVHMC